jgi:hypothetical protein
MKPELKDMMEELQVAFNESVCESDRIAEILADLKHSGYEVLLALEVTIGVTTAQKESAPASEIIMPKVPSTTEFKFTLEDEQFLQDLKIGVA